MHRIQDATRPVWWEPELWPGAAWHFTARLTGATPGVLQAVVLVMDGQTFPGRVTDDMVTVQLSPEQVASITPGAAAQLYLDMEGYGRALWLTGTVVVGRNDR